MSKSFTLKSIVIALFTLSVPLLSQAQESSIADPSNGSVVVSGNGVGTPGVLVGASRLEARLNSSDPAEIRNMFQAYQPGESISVRLTRPVNDYARWIANVRSVAAERKLAIDQFNLTGLALRDQDAAVIGKALADWAGSVDLGVNQIHDFTSVTSPFVDYDLRGNQLTSQGVSNALASKVAGMALTVYPQNVAAVTAAVKTSNVQDIGLDVASRVSANDGYEILKGFGSNPFPKNIRYTRPGGGLINPKELIGLSLAAKNPSLEGMEIGNRLPVSAEADNFIRTVASNQSMNALSIGGLAGAPSPEGLTAMREIFARSNIKYCNIGAVNSAGSVGMFDAIRQGISSRALGSPLVIGMLFGDGQEAAKNNFSAHLADIMQIRPDVVADIASVQGISRKQELLYNQRVNTANLLAGYARLHPDSFGYTQAGILNSGFLNDSYEPFLVGASAQALGYDAKTLVTQGLTKMQTDGVGRINITMDNPFLRLSYANNHSLFEGTLKTVADNRYLAKTAIDINGQGMNGRYWDSVTDIFAVQSNNLVTNYRPDNPEQAKTLNRYLNNAPQNVKNNSVVELQSADIAQNITTTNVKQRLSDGISLDDAKTIMKANPNQSYMASSMLKQRLISDPEVSKDQLLMDSSGMANIGNESGATIKNNELPSLLAQPGN